MPRLLWASLLCLVTAAPAWAQPGLYVTPGVSLIEEYDDNVFSVPEIDEVEQELDPDAVVLLGPEREPRDSMISRVRGELGLGWQSTPLTLAVEYSLDGEAFHSESSLSDLPTRQQLDLRSAWQPSRRLDLALEAGFLETRRPEEVNGEPLVAPEILVADAQPGDVIGDTSRIELQRVRTERWFVQPRASFRLGERTSVLGLAFARRSETALGDESNTVGAETEVGYKLTPRDEPSLRVAYRRFSFDAAPLRLDDPDDPDDPDAEPEPPPEPIEEPVAEDEQDENAVSLLFGWRRVLTRELSARAAAGPRFSNLENGIDATFELTYRLRRFEGLLTYARGQTSAVGETGSVTTDSLGLALRYLWSPTVRAQLSTIGTRNDRGNSDTLGASVRAGVVWQVDRWLSASIDYAFSHQTTDFQRRQEDAPIVGDQELVRNVITFQLRWARPTRLYGPTGRSL